MTPNARTESFLASIGRIAFALTVLIQLMLLGIALAIVTTTPVRDWWGIASLLLVGTVIGIAGAVGGAKELKRGLARWVVISLHVGAVVLYWTIAVIATVFNNP